MISAYLIPLQCDVKDRACGEDPLSLTMYIHGGMWFILFAVDRYLQHKHDESRLLGYLDFYRQTRNLRRMPLFINSCGEFWSFLSLCYLFLYRAGLLSYILNLLSSIIELQSIDIEIPETCRGNHKGVMKVCLLFKNDFVQNGVVLIYTSLLVLCSFHVQWK